MLAPTVLLAEITIVQTSKNGDRHRELMPLENVLQHDFYIELNSVNLRQELAGFGASFTESSAWNLACLPEKLRQEVLLRLFSPDEGMGFTLTRTHINSCDYSLRHYSYVKPGDLALESFSIDEDKSEFSGNENDQVQGVEIVDPSFDLLPLIKAAGDVPGANFRLVASPWSPPSWMKTGEHAEMTGGKLRRDQDENGRLIYYDAWARYLVAYIQSYAKDGISIWALTPQNEPGHADHARWDTCYWSAEWQREFIADYLGPEMSAAGLLDTENLEAGVQLYAFDHNKADLLDFVPVVLDDPNAAKYVRGIAIHWYAINLGGKSDFRGEAIAELCERYPDKTILHTESSIDLHPEDPIGQYWDPMNRDWTGGRFTPFSQYAIDIITDLNQGAIGYIDWCMVLSSEGGPNPYDNFNSAAVLVDPVEDTVLYTPLYFLLGHFSKFIRPQALRLEVLSDLPAGIHATAAKNPDGSVALVVFNDNDEPLTLSLESEGHTLSSTIEADAVQTLLLDPNNHANRKREKP
ncbi:glycoside hydrolase family 30 protein [bacterium]|nr:glycoside hydrolase family 30 protein [bacterium]